MTNLFKLIIDNISAFFKKLGSGAPLASAAAAPAEKKYPPTPMYRVDDMFDQKPSPNFYGNVVNQPRFIVIHWVAGSYASGLQTMLQPYNAVTHLNPTSAHFLLSADGSKVTQMVDYNKGAWHAGHDSWHPLMITENMNHESIGIECEGPPSITKIPWSPKFMDNLINLCVLVKNKFPSIIGIVDHSTILPNKKIDVKVGTGVDLFPWNTLVLRTGLEDLTIDKYRLAVRSHFRI